MNAAFVNSAKFFFKRKRKKPFLRENLLQRHQDKGPFPYARMGQIQLLTLTGLPFIKKQVNIHHPRSMPAYPLSSHGRFDPQADSQQGMGRKIGGEVNALIIVIRLFIRYLHRSGAVNR